jgi:hypothetical protein
MSDMRETWEPIVVEYFIHGYFDILTPICCTGYFVGPGEAKINKKGVNTGSNLRACVWWREGYSTCRKCTNIKMCIH